MGKYLITREEVNNCSTGFLTAVCALLMSAVNCSKNAVFALGSLNTRRPPNLCNPLCHPAG